MSIAIEQTIQVLQVVLQTVPVGTNLALLHLLWSILNGSFLPSRGAIFPGLKLHEVQQSPVPDLSRHHSLVLLLVLAVESVTTRAVCNYSWTYPYALDPIHLLEVLE